MLPPRSSFIITNRPQSSYFIFLINWEIWIDTGVSHGENQINGHIFRVSGSTTLSHEFSLFILSKRPPCGKENNTYRVTLRDACFIFWGKIIRLVYITHG